MNKQSISQLLHPQSVAVIGASNKQDRPGYLVMRNLLQANYNGPIMPVSNKYTAVCGVLAYAKVADLPQVPDLAVITVNAGAIAEVLIELGEKGCHFAILLAAGIPNLADNGEARILNIAKKYCIRLLGGSSLGIQIPHIGLNASFAHQQALPGRVAFISQSSSIATTMLDWANHKGIGFSHFISVGETIDLNFNELLDYLGRDPKTQSILLYIDSIKDHRHFMSAARTAARSKPIIVIKSGKTVEGARSVARHTGEHAGRDVVYDAAFRRAGMLRVGNLHQLFGAFETLSSSKPLKGERLAIITNGGAPAIMAVDALISTGGKLSQLEPEIIERLSQCLPSYWSHSNPVDIAGDATPARFANALTTVLDSKEIDTLLIIHSPTAVASGELFAQAIIDEIKRHKRSKHINILTNWTGEEAAYSARRLLRKFGLPTYRTPEGAVGAFMHMVEYRRNQRLLQQTPKSASRHYQTDPSKVRHIAQSLIRDNHQHIDLHLAQPLLQTYGLNFISTHLVKTPVQAAQKAQEIGFPVALKISMLIPNNKAAMRGVTLNLSCKKEVENAASDMLQRIESSHGAQNINGLVVQKMADTAGAQELRFAMHNDPVFGPVLYLGEVASNWDLNHDAAVALPPLNTALARYMLIGAIKTEKIKDRQTIEQFDINALSITLTQLSYLITDCPEIVSLDINPMLVKGSDITMLDLSMTLQPYDGDSAQRLAIRPYPRELEEIFTLRDGREVLLRPIKAEDEQSHVEFNNSLSSEDRYKRFFGEVGQLSHEAMAKMTQIDFDREMAFIASYRDNDNKFHTLGVVRAITDPENYQTEFAVVIRSDLQAQGLGRKLMLKMIHYCQQRNTQIMFGLTLPQNSGMVTLARKLGFKTKFDIEQGWIEMTLDLRSWSDDNSR
ncbi:MAG: bifunctional acetate--CoA ligase family protein/GNAT family N-acetyltransferase [Psychrobium sp.]|nr:bifunctional acetate--CoA ligase family protein/GNAT family N-acetyltransferase [Psychrobium sp.]